MANVIMLDTLADLLAIARQDKGRIWKESGVGYRVVSTTARCGQRLEVRVEDGTADALALDAINSVLNKPFGGAILDPSNATDFGQAGTAWAFRPQSGKMNVIDSFLGMVDNDINIPASNPLKVNLVLSPENYVLPAWSGTPYAPPDNGLGYGQNDGTWMDVTPVEEAGQNYLKWWHLIDGAYVLTFTFKNLYELLAKSPNPVAGKVGSDDVWICEIPYKARGAVLNLRSSKRERIEIYPKTGTAYNKVLGGSASVCRVTVFSSEYPEF